MRLVELVKVIRDRQNSVPVKMVASMVGKIISMNLVIGSVAQLMTRSLSIDIVNSKSWNHYINLSVSSREQINFWESNIQKLNSRSLRDDSSSSRIVFSDASDFGYGGYCIDIDGAISHGQWDSEESVKSLTWRELKAVDLVLKSFVKDLTNYGVKWFTDNQNTQRIALRDVYKNDIDILPNDLKHLANGLPDFLMKARADNTVKKYVNGFNRWKNWVNIVGLDPSLPVKPFIFSLYLMMLCQSAQSVAPIYTAFYSIKYIHDLASLHSPTDDKLVINILESAKRKLSKPVQKKSPVTVELLDMIYEKLTECPNLYNLRTICCLLLAFAGFLRSAELLNISRTDIVFHESYKLLFIEKSKTDMYRDGAWLPIAKTGGKLCPVVSLIKYLNASGIEQNSCEYIFRGLNKCRDGY
ncbi:hypothetical protein LOTGIDRAFT_161981 [Lottia gigantea]|uniref:Tyr recombinase domain-containing protein n=1 Tax=Lottia gigantea TaxID=225164 RepID=V4BWN1_LOTGI|nr:hypothetical protein LOTGIDRAFT_161981 [Lottia gigantea]ESO93409.1 hypothetical protein LOTGIDRAFT_161981 [Lottia gigantea]